MLRGRAVNYSDLHNVPACAVRELLPYLQALWCYYDCVRRGDHVEARNWLFDPIGGIAVRSYPKFEVKK